jgi:hypothetical protein
LFSFRELHYSVNRSAHKGSNGYDKLIENNESVHKFLEWFSLACHMLPEKLVFWVLEWVCAKKKILLLPCGPGHGMDRALLGRVQQTEEEMRVLLAVASRSGGHLIAGSTRGRWSLIMPKRRNTRYSTMMENKKFLIWFRSGGS